MNILRKITSVITIAGVAGVLALAGAVLVPKSAPSANAAVVDGANSNLGDLLILNSIFGDNNGNVDLGNLFILDQLFSPGTTGSGIFSGSSTTVTVQPGDTLSGIAASVLGNASLYPQIAAANNIADPNLIFPGQVLVIPSNVSTGTNTGTNLGDLLILDNVFGNNNGILNDNGILGNGTNLGDLFVLDKLFGNTNGTNMGTNLGDLLILDNVFGNGNLGNNGILDNGTNLGDLFILDKLFSGSAGNLNLNF